MVARSAFSFTVVLAIAPNFRKCSLKATLLKESGGIREQMMVVRDAMSSALVLREDLLVDPGRNEVSQTQHTQIE